MKNYFQIKIMDLKPIILLSEYKLLRELIKQNPKEGKPLSDELNRAIVIKENELNKKIIRIGSQIEFLIVKTQKKMDIQLVLPTESNFKQQKISIFAPLGTALIGFSEKDEVEWEMPGGKILLKITNVSNDI